MRLFSKKSELVALYLITKNNHDSAKLLARLEPAHFLFPGTNAAFKRFLNILRLKGESLDWLSLCEDPALEEAHRELLCSFEPSDIDDDFSVDNLLRSLEGYRVGRALNALVDYTKEKLKKSFDPEKLFDDLADRLTKARVVTEDQKLNHIGLGNNTSAIVKDILDQTKKPKYIPTGFATYDSLMGGLPESGVVTLAATTSSGKSTMANQLALNMNAIGWDVCKISLEMPEDQEIERFLSNMTGVPHFKIRQKQLMPSEVRKLKLAYKQFVELGKNDSKRITIISPTEDLTLSQILMLIKPFNYKVIIIDYITLLKEPDRVDQWKHLSDVCREAKRFTMKTNCLIIMLAQLDDDNKIRYSRAIKEHCLCASDYVNVDGKLMPVKVAIQQQHRWISTATGERQIAHQYEFGVKPVLRFETAKGFTVTVSMATPVLVETAVYTYCWKPAAAVKVGDNLVIKKDLAFAHQDCWLGFLNKEQEAETKQLKFPLRMSTDLAQLCGYLAACGKIGKNNQWVVLRSAEPKVFMKYIRILTGLFMVSPDCYWEDHAKSVSIAVSSMQLSTFLRYIGVRKQQRIPWAVLQSTATVALHYLQAYFEANPYTQLMEHELRTTVNTRRMATELQLLLLKLGVLAQIKAEPATNYSLTIRDQDYLHYQELQRRLIDGSWLMQKSGALRQRVSHWCRRFLVKSPRKPSDLLTDRIVTRRLDHKKVYDFTVATAKGTDILNQGNFVANGIVIHNSDVCWMWSVTEADKENNKFTINQTKGRNQGTLAFELNARFECFQLTDGGSSQEFAPEEESNETSDISDLMV